MTDETRQGRLAGLAGGGDDSPRTRRGNRPWRVYAVPLAASLLALAAGCRNTELLETALRSREQDVRVLREELARLEYQNEALSRELCAVRHHPGTFRPVLPEAAQAFTVRRLTLGRGTAGVDHDGCNGDEALQVVLEPRDGEGHVLKAPGSVHVLALEVSPEGLKTPLSAWDVGPEELRRTWRQGLFSTGYVLNLPWQRSPVLANVRVVARFVLSDGRAFEAERDVRVRPNPNPPPAADVPFTPAAPDEVLPMPRQAPAAVPEEVIPAPQLDGPALQPAGLWRAPSLEGAVRLRRPQPLYPPGG